MLDRKKPIDWAKPVQTVRGDSVRVLCTDAPGAQPVICLLDNGVINRWCDNGDAFLHGGNYSWDLINVPPAPVTVTRYVNLYDETDPSHRGDSYMYWSEQQARDASAGGNPVARAVEVKITYTPKE